MNNIDLAEENANLNEAPSDSDSNETLLTKPSAEEVSFYYLNILWFPFRLKRTFAMANGH